MYQKLIWLAIAGACGTLSRFGLCELASKVKNTPIPLGTLAVNVIGSFLFGLVYVLVQKRLTLGAEMRMILLVGFMGAFTTFSTYAFETAQLMKSSQWMLALGNITLQTGLGIVAMVAGVLVARAV